MAFVDCFVKVSKGAVDGNYNSMRDSGGDFGKLSQEK